MVGRDYSQVDAGADTAVVADTGGTSFDVSLVRLGRIRSARRGRLELDVGVVDVDRRVERLEQFDASALSEIGRRAGIKRERERLERVVEDVGREIAGAVEHVAGRIEEAISRRAGGEEKAQPRVRVDAR